MRVISPEGLQLASLGGISRPLDTLAGKTIGEVYNNHFKGELMFKTYRRLLKERFPDVKIIAFERFPTVYVGGDPVSQKNTAKEIARLAKELKVDAIITGNGG
jgi:tryptophanase